MKNINVVKEQHEAKLMSTPGVVGVAVGESKGKPCILVLVESGSQGAAKVPRQLGGHPVVVQDTGPIQAQSETVLNGYYQYHAIPGNMAALKRFRERIQQH